MNRTNMIETSKIQTGDRNKKDKGFKQKKRKL